MVLHPQARRSLAQAAGDQSVFDPAFDIDRARQEARDTARAEPREEVAEVRDVDAAGVPCRYFRPATAAPGGAVVIHLHGGGFVLNDIEVHDAACRRLANRSGLAVLSVDYRRPPEHRFPAAPDDVDVVVRWIDDGGLGEAGGGRRLFVHGDSAGGNLALVAALRHPGRFAGAVLVYPFLDPTAAFASYRTAADGFDPAEAGWYWQQYAASPADLTHPDLAPLLSDRLGSLPPTLVVTAEHDPLRDEGEHLAAVLAEAGVSVVATRYLGMIHGFWRHTDTFDAAEPLTRQVAAFLQQHDGPPEPSPAR